MTPAATPIPLTVIGGFLGAGKTTLLNHVLATAQGRYLVLVNDFGAVNIDADLVAEHAGDTLRLTNGCVCCSLADGFLDTLIRVLDGPMLFDHILIEASGVGDPQAIAEIALVEPQLALNAILVLVDAERVASQLADPRLEDTLVRQIAAADLALVNKADLVDPALLADVTGAMQRIKPALRSLPTTHATVPHDVLGLAPASFRPLVRFKATAAQHEKNFTRAVYRSDGCFDRTQLANRLDDMPSSVLRLKGFCRIAGDAVPFLLQMVGARWSMAPRPDLSGRPHAIELVAIGTSDMPAEAAFGALFDAAIVKPAVMNTGDWPC